MFDATCKRPARTARNVASEINFIISYFEDGCRFWILAIDDQVGGNSLFITQENVYIILNLWAFLVR